MLGLAAVLEVLLALALVHRLVPALVGRLFAAPFLTFAPTTAGADYSLRGLLSAVILFTAVLLALRWWLHREPPGQAFGTAGLARQLRVGATALSFMLMLMALSFAFQPGMALQQARSLGLDAPAALLAHVTVYAFIWSGYREELLHRAFATRALRQAVPGSWGLFLAVMLFSGWHFFNTPNLAVAVTWVMTTLPGSLLMTAAYLETGRLYAPWLAHALNNALVGGLTAMALYAPAWVRPGAALLGLGALAWAVLHRAEAAVLWRHIQSVFSGLHRQALQGAGLFALLAGGVWVHWQVPRGNLALYAAHAAGLALALWAVRRLGAGAPGRRQPAAAAHD